MTGDGIVVPFSLRKQILEKIHEGHMGVAKCRERAAQSVWWPRTGKDIKSRVASCRHCLEKQPSQASEPFLPSALPDRPFEKVGIDICEFRKKHYLVQVDYYSRYIDYQFCRFGRPWEIEIKVLISTASCSHSFVRC